MPRLLVAYASREGQTEKICRHIAARLEAAGHSAMLLNLKNDGTEEGIETCAAAIVAGSVHLARHDPALAGFIMRHGTLLRTVPSAFVCVSLSAASKDPGDLATVGEITNSFLYETGWQPDVIEHAAGAVRDVQLGLFERFTVHAVMMEKEIPSHPSGETELTDWAKLDRFVDEFAARAG